MPTSVWDNTANEQRYGTGKPGAPADWQAAYEKVMSEEEADGVLEGRSPHVVLGLPSDTRSHVVIKRTFRKIVRRECRKAFGTEPDEKAVARFKEVHAAYSKLIGKK